MRFFKKDVLDFTFFIVLNIALKRGSFAKSFEKIQIWKFAAYLRDFKSLKRNVDICIFTTYKVKFRSKITRWNAAYKKSKILSLKIWSWKLRTYPEIVTTKKNAVSCLISKLHENEWAKAWQASLRKGCK